MMRVTTLYAGTAATTARYYTRYLADAPGEGPGVWLGQQAAGLGLSGEVSTQALELLLSGRDPKSGELLGLPLLDRVTSQGRVVRAVAGFDATVSAPKSLSVWWGLTGDERLAECHDVAVQAVVDYLERYGATTRIRHNGARLHPETQGLIVGAFRQTTSREDDPQLHTHLVISAKVQTDDGRWLALDARVLKRHQRALGGLYQSVLRAELTDRFGVGFGEIVTGQAEIAGVPTDLIEVFSKRAGQVAAALDVKLAEFWQREHRDPDKLERATLERQAAVDTRQHKTNTNPGALTARWRDEAAQLGISGRSLTQSIFEHRSRADLPGSLVRLPAVIAELSESRSAWHRLDVLRTICDLQRPLPATSGREWSRELDRAVDGVLGLCVDLEPNAPGPGARVRGSDGRSVWSDPIAPTCTSWEVIGQEREILDWATAVQAAEPCPSRTVDRTGLDLLQGEAAGAVAGEDRLVLIVGPAGAGKTTMLRAVEHDFHVAHHRPIWGFTPTAKAAIVLHQETGIYADTVAMALHNASRDPGEDPLSGPGTTVVIDEAGMLSTPDLHRIIELANRWDWRLVLVGDPHQLQPVGRGGMFAELCRTGHPIELQHVHRFTNPWEAAASLRLRTGDTHALDHYELFQRIRPGLFIEHLDTIATAWAHSHRHGQTLAVTTTTNDHVDTINQHIQQHRIDTGELDTRRWVPIANDRYACVGDVIATRHNHRRLTTSHGDHVRNRETWTVTDTNPDGDLTARRTRDNATVTLPAGYVREHVQLGYAATEHGTQADTTTRAITLITNNTTGRGLYVGMTRGREHNLALVVTGDHDPATARDTLEDVLHNDRADTPAITRQRDLEQQRHPLLADCDELLARLPDPDPQPEWTTPTRSLGREIDF